MRASLRPAAVMLVLLTIITGVIYPLVVTGIARVAFARESVGSPIDGGAGSDRIGQPFSSPRYFWGRLSATGPFPYNAAASTGSNYGPLNPALVDAARARIDAMRAAGDSVGAVPVDLVTASGSGLDPHITPAAAMAQVTRVANARGLESGVLRGLVADAIEDRQWGVLGEPRVNVLRLNLALDALTRRGSDRPAAADTLP